MYQYRVDKVIKVVDGDTVDVLIDMGFDIKYKSRVRLYGINAPESRTRDRAEKRKGMAAKKRLKELMKSDELIIATRLDKKGKYGRVLGTFLAKHGNKRLDVNDTLVKEGHAVEYFGGKRK
ncbi:nuclease [Candidatus Pacearchaeota archaeon]|nr:nuclease [Candidatus Pacearchaeota archaeon]|tara:strand:- start:569 stop:931 length:363 start_codon:yes stop_codon:yes gene_type:complete